MGEGLERFAGVGDDRRAEAWQAFLTFAIMCFGVAIPPPLSHWMTYMDG